MNRITMLSLAVAAAMCAQADRLVGKAEIRSTVAIARYFTQPALCPARAEIAFASGGDLWVAPSSGGQAKLLVSNAASESRPIYSPDGTRLAFLSDRSGAANIYILTIATNTLTRLTFDNVAEQLDGWSRDGQWIYFSSTRHNTDALNFIYRVGSHGGTPMPVIGETYLNQFQAAPAPGGSKIAFVARGDADRQWWRKGDSHLDQSEIWLRTEAGPAPKYERLVELDARNLWPMWTPDGKRLYFMSDRGGAQNLWTLPSGGGARQVTNFKRGRVLWPSIGYDGKQIVFEHDFQIWKLDTRSGAAAPLHFTLSGQAAGPEVQHYTYNGADEMALSPDGKRVAFTSHGDVFLAAQDGGNLERITDTAGPESELEWSPDSSRLVYIAERGTVAHVYIYNPAQRREVQLTSDTLPDRQPHFSPDGSLVAFERDYRELRVVGSGGRGERLLASGDLRIGGQAWSPDGKWLAYLATEAALKNAYIVSVSGGAARQASFLPNGQAASLQWSANGRFLIFQSGQRTERQSIARTIVAGPNSADPVLENIRERTHFLPIGLEATGPVISPDAKSLVFVGYAVGHGNLYVMPLDEKGWPKGDWKQLTSTKGRKFDVRFTADSRRIYYLDGGNLRTVALSGGEPREIPLVTKLDVDFEREKIAVFNQAWSVERDWFFDARMNGVDWNAVYREYLPLVRGARTAEELRTLLRLMLGELNASHLDVYAPAKKHDPETAELGVSFDRALYESNGTMKVAGVLPGSPAAAARISVGEKLEAVDGVLTGARVNLDQLLRGKAGKQVVLTVGGRRVNVKPVASVKAWVYQRWVDDNRAYVSRVSDGRLGYVHMRDMYAESLSKLYMDLDAENRKRDGIVLDVRNNNGGFVNSWALDVLSRRTYVLSTDRGGDPGSARTTNGQRALDLPTILVVNQHTLSDGENFTEGYRALHLGKIVGEPTAGWDIGTAPTTLLDGSIIRVPRGRNMDQNGRNLEGNPRPVDFAVTRPIGESDQGRDSQLDAAVSKLLAQIGWRLNLPALLKRAR